MIDWLRSWPGSSRHLRAPTPREALQAKQASYPKLVVTDNGRDLGEALFADLEPKIPPTLRALFDSGRAVIGEVGIRSPAAFANALPSGGYWVEIYSGLGPFYYAAAHALYSSVNLIGADGTVTNSRIDIDRSDTELVKLLRAYAANGEVLESNLALSAGQIALADKLARAAQAFVVAHELGHLIKWETDKSTELTTQAEIAADKLGLSISLGMLKQDDVPLSGITEAYAGAEFALRLFSALNALGFDFQADNLHPYPKDRLETLRSQASGIFGTLFDFIFVSRRAFSHDLILQRMEDSVAGRKGQTGIRITSAIQGVATLASWIGATATYGGGPEKAASQFEGIYEKTTGEMRAEIACDLAKAYTDEPISGGDSTVRIWRREKEALATVLPLLSVDCRKWVEGALENARNKNLGRQDPAARRLHNRLTWRYTPNFSDRASVIAGSPLDYKPVQDAINILLTPDAPHWVEGTPRVSKEIRTADGLIRIPSQFAFYATLEEHDPECDCGCQGAPVVLFMLEEERAAVVTRMQARNMIWSAAGGYEDEVLQYLNNGVDIESEYDGATALMLAAQQGQLRIVEVLLDRGARIGTVTSDGRSAIFLAAGRGHTQVVRLLLNRGGETNVSDDEGQTPLMYAAMNGRLETVELLLECGASSEIKSRSGWTALMHARDANATEVVKCLEAREPRG